jgi:hypothetical protein
MAAQRCAPVRTKPPISRAFSPPLTPFSYLDIIQPVFAGRSSQSLRRNMLHSSQLLGSA